MEQAGGFIASGLEPDDDQQFVLRGVDQVGFSGATRSAADLGHQLALFPSCLTLDVRRLVLDLLAVGRQSSGAAVTRGDHDHRFGLHDGHVIRRRDEVSPRLLPTSGFIRISSVASRISTTPAVKSSMSMAAATREPATSARVLTGALAWSIVGDVTQLLVQGPFPGNRRR